MKERDRERVEAWNREEAYAYDTEIYTIQWKTTRLQTEIRNPEKEKEEV